MMAASILASQGSGSAWKVPTQPGYEAQLAALVHIGR